MHQDEIHGRFRPSNVGHFDEVHMPFVFGADEMYEFEGAKRVYVKTLDNVLDKRQCTVSLTFNAGPDQ